MENYIVINGKKAELTEEQLEKLGIKANKPPFDGVVNGNAYYYIGCDGQIRITAKDNMMHCGDLHFDVVNYCANKGMMEQRALHKILNSLLWRYSMQHGWDKISWGITEECKFYIAFDYYIYDWKVCMSSGGSKIIDVPYFSDENTAKAAIEEIVKPFVEKYPEFKR